LSVSTVQVFIIDGNEARRSMLRLLFRGSSFTVVGEAADLESAIMALLEQQPDAVLLGSDLQQESVLRKSLPSILPNTHILELAQNAPTPIDICFDRITDP